MPLSCVIQVLHITVRLACVKHAASVRSEPGSNSHVQSILKLIPESTVFSVSFLREQMFLVSINNTPPVHYLSYIHYFQELVKASSRPIAPFRLTLSILHHIPHTVNNFFQKIKKTSKPQTLSQIFTKIYIKLKNFNNLINLCRIYKPTSTPPTSHTKESL